MYDVDKFVIHIVYMYNRVGFRGIFSPVPGIIYVDNPACIAVLPAFLRKKHGAVEGHLEISAAIRPGADPGDLCPGAPEGYIKLV
ncbi:hypothetical protein [Eubacterium pyruvativorans]|uniref:hypothetical protein n=1 Tax=Eubacterium pyruvativorans TaxID=155865 RepID=UPI0015689DBE|nr:hypothetical protein [Eubacterium pyruvativorans]